MLVRCGDHFFVLIASTTRYQPGFESIFPPGLPEFMLGHRVAQ
jgi:hypothetical protein